MYERRKETRSRKTCHDGASEESADVTLCLSGSNGME
jgi:hypothetical protein